jgi:hypothetical protein
MAVRPCIRRKEGADDATVKAKPGLKVHEIKPGTRIVIGSRLWKRRATP